ncbi:MAG: type II secretion system F family protein [Candidatus Altiarchaeota archaeon]|nr:type II secretion system F family protein [Candidatus Altiarchaeota archaeon]
MSFFTFLAKLLPINIRKGYRRMIECSLMKIDPDKYIGMAMVAGIIMGLIITIVASGYKVAPPIVLFIAGLFAAEIVAYIYVSLSASQKSKTVEEALPDALQLMASNIRAGLTTDKALLLAARPEFGPLEEEIRRIGKETMAGRDLIDALKKTNARINSTNLDRALELIINSLKSGGQLADLLDETADDIRDQQIVQKEISASVLMYVMFIFIALALGAPLLFSMSSFLVKLLTTNMQLIAAEMPKDFGMSATMPISITEVKISPDFIMRYSVISISVSCLFGSLIMGLIMHGEEKDGFKYVPVMLFISLTLYFVSNYMLDTFLGSMMIR